MCVMCNPAFAGAFRNYAFPSRRQILKSTAAATASAFVCEAATSVPAQAQGVSLQDLTTQFDRKKLPRVTVFRAKEIITLDPDKPSATAVAVLGDRILAVGSADELKMVAGGQPFVIDDTFADKVITPGLIAQHDHPLLTGLTMVSEIIAIEDWVLPSGVVPAANSPSEYRARLADANAKLKDPAELLLTWGYHPVFHGPLTRSDLDRISGTRPIIVWHRSAHEFIVNSKALESYGIDAAFVANLSGEAQDQSNLDEGHFWEGGMFGVIPKLLPAIATPDRIRRGLEFLVRYYHANGVTLGCEPGGLFSNSFRTHRMRCCREPTAHSASISFRTANRSVQPSPTRRSARPRRCFAGARA